MGQYKIDISISNILSFGFMINYDHKHSLSIQIFNLTIYFGLKKSASGYNIFNKLYK